MSVDDYLNRLRAQLKGFLPEQQDEILAEVAAHIEEGERDDREPDLVARRQRILDEMGSPADMGAGFRDVYRPNRWLEFLLIVIPAYLFFPLINVLYNLFTRGGIYRDENQFFGFTIRAVILLGLVMLFISIRRRSLLLFAFWAPDVIARLVSLISREGSWLPSLSGGLYSLVETLLADLLLIALTFLLSRTVWKNRANLLIVLFALQPIIGTLFGGFTTQYGISNGIYPHYPNSILFGEVFNNVLEITSLAGFILLRPRDLRWAAFLLGMGKFTAFMVISYWPNPLLVTVWASYTAILFVMWAIDGRRRLHLSD